METLFWLRLMFIGGMLAFAALAVAAVTLLDRFRRRPAGRIFLGPPASAAPAGGHP